MCHGLCSALGLAVLGIINAYIYIYFDRFTWSLQAIWQHWDFSFSFSSQIGQLPLLLISRSQTQYRSLPRKGRNNEHRTPQVSPGRQHKDLLLELRGLERSGKARCHLLEQRLCQNLHPLLQEISERASGKGPFFFCEPNWRDSQETTQKAVTIPVNIVVISAAIESRREIVPTYR